MPGGGLSVDGEDDGCHPLTSVVLGDLRHGRVVFLALEVGGCGSEQLVVQRQVAVGILFDVHVHVDRDQRVDVEAAHLGIRCLPVADAV